MNALTNLTISFLQPLIDYQEVREAERRTEAAGKRLSMAVVSLAVFIVIWVVFKFVAYRTRKIPRGTVPDVATPAPRPSLSFICWAGAVGCAVAAAYLLYLRITTDIQGSILPLVASLIWVGGALLKQGNRLATPLAEDTLKSDPRRPIIFLRSFSEEEMPFHESTLWGLPTASEQLEEVVLEKFRRFGPVVGLTNPNLVGRPIAYSPYDTPRSVNWKTRVEELLKRSAAIAVLVGEGEGLEWEILYLAKNRYLSRTTFIFPPVEARAVERRLEWLQSKFELSADKIVRVGDENKSTMGHQPLTMRLDRGHAYVFVGSTDALGYEAAVERALTNQFGPRAVAGPVSCGSASGKSTIIGA